MFGGNIGSPSRSLNPAHVDKGDGWVGPSGEWWRNKGGSRGHKGLVLLLDLGQLLFSPAGPDPVVFSTAVINDRM